MPSTAIAALLAFCCLAVPRPILGSLQPSQQRDLLQLHNVLRASVSPRPCVPLLPMTWDDRLAAVAQSYAERCIWAHNKHRHEQAGSEFSRVGENLAFTTWTSENATQSVQDWYDEVGDYDYSSNRCSSICGHYTQLVWNTSTLLGCGAHVCTTRSSEGLRHLYGKGHPKVLMVVCNYGPAGNWRAERPYSTTCSGGSGSSGDDDSSSAASHSLAAPGLSFHGALLCCLLSVIYLPVH